MANKREIFGVWFKYLVILATVFILAFIMNSLILDKINIGAVLQNILNGLIFGIGTLTIYYYLEKRKRNKN